MLWNLLFFLRTVWSWFNRLLTINFLLSRYIFGAFGALYLKGYAWIASSRGIFCEIISYFLKSFVVFVLWFFFSSQIMQALVEHYSRKGWLQRIEQCVLHMDISSLDFNQVFADNTTCPVDLFSISWCSIMVEYWHFPHLYLGCQNLPWAWALWGLALSFQQRFGWFQVTSGGAFDCFSEQWETKGYSHWVCYVKSLQFVPI